MIEKIKKLKKLINSYKKMSYVELGRIIEEELEPEEYRYNMIKLLEYEIKELENEKEKLNHDI